MSRFKYYFLTLVLVFAASPMIYGQGIADSLFTEVLTPESVFKKVGDVDEVKGVVEVEPGEKVKMKLIAPKVLAIQLPCPQQYSWWECGYHSFVNSGILARNNSFRDAVKELNGLNAGRDVKDLIEAYGKGKRYLYEGDLEKFNAAEYEAEGKFSVLDNMKKALQKTGDYGQRRSRVYFSDLMRSIIVYKRDPYTGSMGIESGLENALEKAAKQFSGRDSKAEILMCNYFPDKHWIALRVERMKNGWIAVIYADSLGKTIGEYQKLFMNLVKKIDPKHLDEPERLSEEEKRKLFPTSKEESVSYPEPEEKPKEGLFRFFWK